MDLVKSGADVKFVVEDSDGKLGFAWRVYVTGADDKAYMLTKNQGQETFVYEIKSANAVVAFGRKRDIDMAGFQFPNKVKYPKYY